MNSAFDIWLDYHDCAHRMPGLQTRPANPHTRKTPGILLAELAGISRFREDVLSQSEFGPTKQTIGRCCHRLPPQRKAVEPDAMSFLNWLRKRRFNPTKDWPPAGGLLPTLQIEPFQFGSISFGSGVNAARSFGRADQVNCFRYPGTFDLTWRRPPLRLSYEDNAFVEVLVPTGYGTLNGARDGAPLSVVKLPGGAVWDNGTTAVAVENLLGKPETTEAFEDGEKWLVYRFGGHVLQLEFNRDGCLAAVSMYTDD